MKRENDLEQDVCRYYLLRMRGAEKKKKKKLNHLYCISCNMHFMLSLK